MERTSILRQRVSPQGSPGKRVTFVGIPESGEVKQNYGDGDELNKSNTTDVRAICKKSLQSAPSMEKIEKTSDALQNFNLSPYFMAFQAMAATDMQTDIAAAITPNIC